MAERKGPHLELSEDNQKLLVTFPTEPIKVQLQYDAGQVDGLIHALGELRMAMVNEHPKDFALGQKVEAIYDPRWVTEADLLEGDSLIHLRHPGFGWLSFLLPRHEAAKLAQFLQDQARAPPSQPQSAPH